MTSVQMPRAQKSLIWHYLIGITAMVFCCCSMHAFADDANNTKYKLRDAHLPKFMSAKTALKERNYKSAIEILKELKSTESLSDFEHAMASLYLGAAYGEMGNNVQAQHTYEQILELEDYPQLLRAQFYSSLGSTYKYQGQQKKAIKALLTGLEMQRLPRANTLAELGTAYYLDEQYDNAAQYLEQAVIVQQVQGGFPKEGWILYLMLVGERLKSETAAVLLVQNLRRVTQLYPNKQRIEMLLKQTQGMEPISAAESQDRKKIKEVIISDTLSKQLQEIKKDIDTAHYDKSELKLEMMLKDKKLAPYERVAIWELLIDAYIGQNKYVLALYANNQILEISGLPEELLHKMQNVRSEILAVLNIKSMSMGIGAKPN